MVTPRTGRKRGTVLREDDGRLTAAARKRRAQAEAVGAPSHADLIAMIEADQGRPMATMDDVVRLVRETFGDGAA